MEIDKPETLSLTDQITYSTCFTGLQLQARRRQENISQSQLSRTLCRKDKQNRIINQ